MQDKNTVSVIIVNYNAGDYLRRCLESLFLSDIPLEIVVVDNASHDRSEACVETLDSKNHRVKLLRNTSNVGFATAVNRGVDAASGDVIVLLNPDSTVHPDSIRVLTEALCSNENAAIAGGLVFNENGTEQNGCRRREPDLMRSAAKAIPLLRTILRKQSADALNMAREPLPSIPVPVDAVSGSFMAVKRQVFNETGGMDSSYFLHCEDLDVCRVVRDKGYQVLFVPGAAVFHQQGVSGGSHPYRVEWHKRNGMLRYFNKHHASEYDTWKRMLVSLLVSAHFVRSCLTIFVKGVRTQNNDVPSQVYSEQKNLYGDRKTILVTGASSAVGKELIDRLANEKFNVIAITRSNTTRPATDGLRWFNTEYLHKVSANHFPAIHAMIHLAPIWSLPALLPQLSRLGISRIIAISSTSALAKKTGVDKREREIAAKLSYAEDAAQMYAQKNNIALTILRATMIYDGYSDQNVSSLIRFIKRFGFFLLPGSGSGLRQPVHIDDLVSACIQAMDNSSAVGKTYVISGRHPQTYREMVSALFHYLGKAPRFIAIPPSVMRFAMACLAKIMPGKNLSSAMIDRMQSDLCYSHDEAGVDFNYAPKAFSIGRS